MLDTFSKTANLKKTNIMKKLSLDALKNKAEGVASEELLNTISGGLENGCHTHYSTETGSVTISGGTITIKP
jgi:hypothetical protein